MKSITFVCFALLCISYISARNISDKSVEDTSANKAIADGDDSKIESNDSVLKKNDAASGNTFSLRSMKI